MPKLSNENISLHDRVFDIIQGYGKVADMAFNDIVVKFDNGVRITFDKNGNYGGVRRLYWHNPIVIDPPKDNARWGVLQDCINAVRGYIL